MTMDCDTLSAAPVYFFAGRAFLDAGKQDLLACLDGCEPSQSDPEWSRAEWEQALAVDGQSLEKEYVRLFLSPAGAPCSPWQSANSPDPALMGEAHHSALAFYREAGLEPGNPAEPADHIGLLLAFYGNLLESDAPAEMPARFREAHFEWIPAFCDRLEKEARLDFYRLLARLARRLV